MHQSKRIKIHIWTTSQVLPYHHEGKAYVIAREIIFLIVTIFLLIFITFGTHSLAMYQLKMSLTNYFLETKFKTTNGDFINFHEIKTATDFWDVEKMVCNEYWHNSENSVAEEETKVLYENRMVTGARIRQLRVRNNSCPIHDYMVRNFQTCYGRFTKRAEDTSPFGIPNGPGWTYNSPEEAMGIKYYGVLNVYPPGGYYEILKDSKKLSLEIINGLKKNLWLTKGTRLIIYEFVLYNGNVDLLCAINSESWITAVLLNSDAVSHRLTDSFDSSQKFCVCESQSFVLEY
ncbi:hypothetical protein FQA39_LY01537 [Lamprigera yunnana]|nr:hypothetical protein FQA39_LY01537 [Lamprigera yunnana]